MKKLLVLILLLSLGGSNIHAQSLSKTEIESFKKSEDSLLLMADSMNKAFVNADRLDYCYKFIQQLSHVLKQKNSYYYPFENLSKKIHILSPEDKSFRIFNWSIEHTIARYRYYGAIQRADGKAYPLVDKSQNIEDKQLYGSELTNDLWYGQVYYRILTKTDNAGQPIYFLMGLNNDGMGISTKILDAIRFTPSKVIFGGNYFKIGNQNAPGAAPRFVMQYQKGAQVYLNLDQEKGFITYDKLMSEINQPQRTHTLVPSGQIDGLQWTNGMWHPVQNVIPLMKLRDGQAPINGVIPN